VKRPTITITIDESDAQLLYMSMMLGTRIQEPARSKLTHTLRHAMAMCNCDAYSTHTVVQKESLDDV
jgi:hypothetical protein